MYYHLIKIAITTCLIVIISEIAKRNSWTAAILASIPLISVLAMTWLYIDTKDIGKVSELALSIFWLVIPSLAFFIGFPLCVKFGMNFYASMGISLVLTVMCYWIMLTLLTHFGIKLS